MRLIIDPFQRLEFMANVARGKSWSDACQKAGASYNELLEIVREARKGNRSAMLFVSALDRATRKAEEGRLKRARAQQEQLFQQLQAQHNSVLRQFHHRSQPSVDG